MHPTMERLYEAARTSSPPVTGQSAVARALGETPQVVKNWESRGVSKRGLVKAQSVFDVDATWLERGNGTVRKLAAVTDSGADYHHETDDADAMLIPLLANGASMGPGNDELDGDVFIGALTVSERWVTREVRPSSPGALRFIHAYGESMAPTFADGDVLLVDTGARDPATIDGIYVLRAHGRLFVKRVRQRLDGQIEISSDNPTVKTVDVLDGSSQIEAMGRVIWAWNGRKL